MIGKLVSCYRSYKLWLLGAALVTVFLALAGLALLRLGNPQWSKYMYMFQCYVWPSYEQGRIPLAPDYTGTAMHWGRKGNLLWQGELKNGKIHGVSTTWHENGTKIGQIFCKDGQSCGTWRMWYPNGQLRLEYSFRNGRRHGVYREWYQNGQLEEKGMFDDGSRVGEWTWWHDNGRIAERGRYGVSNADLGGKMQGIWTEWHRNGQIAGRRAYSDDELVGVWTEWNENGEKVGECDFGSGSGSKERNPSGTPPSISPNPW